MTMKQLVVLLAAALVFATPSAATNATVPFQILPPEGFIPDAGTAAKISEVILARFVGEAQTDRDKPFTVTLEDGVWIVKGAPPPPNAFGGIAELHISKKDGTILFMLHEM
jgi:NTF2 fold immunity protein of polymorphic toxin system component